MDHSFEVLSDQWGLLGESPIWSEHGYCIWWVDIEGRRLLCTDARNGQTRAWPTAEEIGFIALRPDGILVAGLGAGLFVFDSLAGHFSPVCVPETRSDVRFNDSGLDPAGRLWAGTMHRTLAQPVGAVFCIESDFSYRRVFDGFFTPNGIAFDPVRRRMYMSDSHPSVQTIWVCDYDVATGTPSNRRVFATTHNVHGRPDGAFVDGEGIYWIAGIGGSQLLRFSPSGQALEPIPVPVEHPTKLVMDNAQPRTLYMTSRRMPDGPRPDLSGYLLRCILA